MKFQILKNNINNILIGSIVGVVIFIVFYLLNFSFSLSGSLIDSFVELHSKTNTAWFIDIFPILFTIIAVIFGSTYQSRIKHLNLKLKQELRKSNNILKHVEEVYNGNLEYQADKSNKISKILLELQKKIKDNRLQETSRIKEDEQRHWISSGHAKFSEILRTNSNNINQLASIITNNLIEYLKIYQGGFYLLESNDDSEKYLELIASYAFDRQKLSDKRIELGCGLVGACAVEKETIYIKNIPDNYINISSGLGNSKPTCVLIIPLKHNEELTGVIELANLKAFKPYEIEFLETLADNIASTIISVKSNIKTAELLKQSQQQSIDLTEKEEELRSSLLELRETQEKSMKQSEDFKTFTNAVNHTMISGEYNENGSLINANPKFIQKLGYKDKKELIGKNILNFIDPTEQKSFRQNWRDLTQKGTHFEGDVKHFKKDGSGLWMTSTYVCTRNTDGSVRNVLFLASDITERKEKNLDFQAQIEAINLSSIKVEILPDGKIIESNEIFRESIKYTKYEIEKFTFKDFISESKQEAFESLWENLLKGVPYKGVLQFTDKYGKEKWYQGAASTIQDDQGEIKKIIYIANDVSKQKAMELEIQKSEEVLKQKLDHARKELKDQFKEIELEKVRSDLILEGMLDAIFSFDDKGTISFFNKAGENLWGYSKKEIINNNIKLLFSEHTRENDDFVNRLTDPSKEKYVSVRQEVNILGKNGQEEAVLMLISEANVKGQKTYTAFVQSIEMELF